MPATRAFVSFDADNDENLKILFCGQTSLSSVPFDVHDWSSKVVLPQKRWRDLIAEKIAKCHTLIILVGNDTSSASGVIEEIGMAASVNVPSFGVYIDGAGIYTPLPLGLARNRVIDWTWPGVASAIQQMMGEGKNKLR